MRNKLTKKVLKLLEVKYEYIDEKMNHNEIFYESDNKIDYYFVNYQKK